MENTVNPTDVDGAQNAGAAMKHRSRTQIEFPYTDIGQAEELARTLVDRGGGTAETAQLAGWMDQSANGGTFRSRLSAARMFGFIESDRGSGVITITSSGRDVVDANRRAAARVDAFMKVPLFAAMYEKNNGYNLPPPAALERQVVELGVPEKQKERARQVFQKSASIAQFIDPTTGRFVKPAVRPVKEEDNTDTVRHNSGDESNTGSDSVDRQYHPFVQGLLDELPASEEFMSWPVEDQAEWLRAAASIFKLLSKTKGRIVVSCPGEQTPTPKEGSASDYE
ncbi:hypothetical protein HH303_05170 [Rhodospirillaceae bacterium KN72]|uniref:Uncharacterized protein n=1 Tax=Pacificispira spongiicola TaxID=2729598 RepID=A0A7Y0DYC7_9PROT|nr:hypothetical protein [Pacificispira spongiicola]NMM43857.1 hypothetical protein [Pacificispira spongiicola]